MINKQWENSNEQWKMSKKAMRHEQWTMNNEISANK